MRDGGGASKEELVLTYRGFDRRAVAEEPLPLRDRIAEGGRPSPRGDQECLGTGDPDGVVPGIAHPERDHDVCQPSVGLTDLSSP